MCADSGIMQEGFGVDVETLPGRPVSVWGNIPNTVTVAAVAADVGQQHPEEKDMEKTLHKLEELTLPLFSHVLFEVRTRIDTAQETHMVFLVCACV